MLGKIPFTIYLVAFVAFLAAFACWAFRLPFDWSITVIAIYASMGLVAAWRSLKKSDYPLWINIHDLEKRHSEKQSLSQNGSSVAAPKAATPAAKKFGWIFVAAVVAIVIFVDAYFERPTAIKIMFGMIFFLLPISYFMRVRLTRTSAPN